MPSPTTHLSSLGGILLGCLLSACATVREPAPPVPVANTPASVPEDSISTPQDPAIDRAEFRTYSVLRAAFKLSEQGRPREALTLADSAASMLAAALADTAELLPPKQLAGLVQVALEIYHDLLPEGTVLAPGVPLAVLMDSLPEAVSRVVASHPFYRAFHIQKLAGTADVPVDVNEEVLSQIRYFETSGRETYALWLSRSSRYLPMIRQALREGGLPEDLAYKAMIESGFNPRAYSRARAAGIWQFVRSTAPLYSLKRNTWIDERRDPEKSTRAAVRHIANLRRLFEDWRLVVAAYNCGQGRLERIIRRSGTRDFWRLKGLPRETRAHVPRFMAALLISKDPEFFGFGDVERLAPLTFDTVQVNECVDLRVAAECTGVSFERLRELNPELRMGYTPPPPVSRLYDLKIPAGSIDRFRSNYARVPADRKVQMVDYRVRSGDTVSGIAKRMRVSQQAVLDANGIRNPRSLLAGKRLKIPIGPRQRGRARRIAAAEVQAAADPSTHDPSVYVVRRGDTLWGIGRRQGVGTEQIKAWNKLGAGSRIYPGNRLVIWVPRESAQEAKGLVSRDSTNGEFYTVKPGDTLWHIARFFNTSVRDLKRWNGIRVASSLRAGARLLVRPVDQPRAN